MSDNAQFDQWLRQNLSQLQDGTCPGMDTLARFGRGELDRQQAQEVERHIAGCGYCDLTVDRIRAFEQALKKEMRPAWGWLVPAVSVAVVLSLAYPAYLGLQPRPAPIVIAPPAVAAMRSAQVLDLNATRGASSLPVRAGPSPVLALNFFAPIEDGHHYTATITGPRALPSVEIATYDGRGNFSLTVDRANLPAGSYKLTVADRELPDRHWDFPFEL
jgi:hypothetical protein